MSDQRQVLIAHKIQLDPNNRQETYFRKACGVARFAYNWALAEWKREYEAGGKPSWVKIKTRLNSIKRTEFPWMLEVTKCAAEHALQNLVAAYERFFKKTSRYPQFKKRGVHDSFYLSNDKFTLTGKRVRIPKLGCVRIRESLRFTGKIMSATVSRVADRWFISISVEVPETKPKSRGSIGIDLGIHDFVTLSTGEKVQAPKPLKEGLKRLRRLNKDLSRKKIGSGNRDKAKTKLSRFYYRLSCIRNDFLHKLSTRLSRRYRVIGIEDLNVRGMVKNRRLARAISDLGWGEFKRQIEYKATKVVEVGRFYPSSKTCSSCGFVLDDLPLSTRSWSCPSCHSIHDRDINAAKNILRTARLAGIACRDGSSGVCPRRSDTKLLSVKQELGKEKSHKSGKFPLVKRGKCSKSMQKVDLLKLHPERDRAIQGDLKCLS